MKSERKNEIIREYGVNDKDTGSVYIQIALLTERIKILVRHCHEHKHDYHSKRGLMMLIGYRRRLLKYLTKKDHESYKDLIKKLGLRK